MPHPPTTRGRRPGYQRCLKEDSVPKQPTDPRNLSQRELDELLDRLIENGEDEKDTALWRTAHAEWERREDG